MNPFGTFDVAVLDNNNFEGGNANGALPQGQSTSVSFLLSGTNLLANTVESDFFTGFSDGSLKAVARFQQVNAGAGSDKLLLEDDGIIDDGTVDDGTVDDGTVDDGTVDDGTVDDGTVDDGTVDDGNADGGSGDDDGAGDDGTVDDGTDDGMTEIPEPTTVGGLLFFLGGFLASRRKSS
ncbi:MAG: PEP-CTERM sorting domain-containing protein [Hydrococcus sp. RM1_1_31]|nr:PEP-CTERM sorting domain-containing protein [Hydrococcus sp. RM1_1_31]